MRYDKIDTALFIENRKRLVARLLANSMAIFNSNDIMPTNADGTMGFRQNSDLFYLSGIDQEESILMIFPDSPDAKHKEVLFLKQTSELIKIWEGAKYTKEEARATSGITTIYWLEEFQKVMNTMVFDSERIYLNTNEHIRAAVEVETRDARFLKKMKEMYPLHEYKRLAPIMHNLRSVKNDIEIQLIQKAAKITEQGFRRLLKFVKPGVWEHEIEAELWHEFVRNRSRGHAYFPIIASGANSCILHYNDNNKICKDGDLILLDFGAEYANYASDLTRTIPVNGRYTKRQKEVYNAVLKVMKAAIKMLVPGNNLESYHKAVGELMQEELIKLGLLNKTEVQKQNPEFPLYKKYFMHGTSHLLGLDVHDVGHRTRTFKPGMVFTCEPGIYIPEEEIGIRIENDILITGKAPFDLMADIPIEADDIEELMKN